MLDNEDIKDPCKLKLDTSITRVDVKKTTNLIYRSKAKDIRSNNVVPLYLDAHDEIKRFLWSDSKTVLVQTRNHTLISDSTDPIIIDLLRSEPIPSIYTRNIFFISREYNCDADVQVEAFVKPKTRKTMTDEELSNYNHPVYRATIIIDKTPLSPEKHKRRSQEVVQVGASLKIRVSSDS